MGIALFSALSSKLAPCSITNQSLTAVSTLIVIFKQSLYKTEAGVDGTAVVWYLRGQFQAGCQLGDRKGASSGRGWDHVCGRSAPCGCSENWSVWESKYVKVNAHLALYGYMWDLQAWNQCFSQYRMFNTINAVCCVHFLNQIYLIFFYRHM